MRFDDHYKESCLNMWNSTTVSENHQHNPQQQIIYKSCKYENNKNKTGCGSVSTKTRKMYTAVSSNFNAVGSFVFFTIHTKIHVGSVAISIFKYLNLWAEHNFDNTAAIRMW